MSATTKAEKIEWAWRPQIGPQKALVDCHLPEVFMGGARGGGKTDGVLGKWALKERRYGAHFNAVMFRRTTVSAEDAIERSKEIYGKLGARFNEQRLRWRMPHGGRVAFAYLESVRDADEYQGRNLTDAWVEEAGQYPSSAAIDRLFGVLRSAHGVPVQLILTGNPGGAGQHWIRERYQLHPFPRGPKILERILANGAVHKIAVIPSRIENNRFLGPDYINRLHLVGSAQLVKAWLEGDWTAIEAAFFDCFADAKHVIAPFTIPSDWLRFRSGDWGSASPFSIGWWAVVQDDYPLDAGKGVLPRGALVRYREWYGASAPGKGLKLTAEQVADGIIARERGENLTYGVLDPSTFREDGGPSIAERINTRLIAARMAPFRGADNSRVSEGPMGGWDQMRARLIGDAGRPMLYLFSTCRDSIRTIPLLQHDPDRPEDLDTNSEDHCADDVRYACLSRPWVKAVMPKAEPRDGYHTVGEDAAESFKTL
jgi:hypothetical protein